MRISCHLSTTEATQKSLSEKHGKTSTTKTTWNSIAEILTKLPIYSTTVHVYFIYILLYFKHGKCQPRGNCLRKLQARIELGIHLLTVFRFFFIYIFDGTVAAFCFHLERKCVADIFDIIVFEFSRETEAISRDKSFGSTASGLPPQLFHQLLSCFHV